ncbi:hypothetical protein GY45DRAFT_277611 [Cubamyces sp. BRFM 1775]|nr:hypothetical protein GY45DRAFT_277611 [Cubamyces sp. BRFM 1775]
MAEIELSFEALTARCDELVEQQTALGRELASIRRAYNASRPINKLPVELLIMIFQLLQVRCGKFNPSWYAVAAVCKHWYRLANDITTLWRRIDFRFMTQVCDVFLTRPGMRTADSSGWLPEFKNSSFEHVRGRLMGTNRKFEVPAKCCFRAQALRYLARFATFTEVLEVQDDRRVGVSEEGYVNRERSAKADVRAFRNRYSTNLALHMDPATFPRLWSLSLVTVAFAPNLVSIPTLRELYLSDCVCTSTSMRDFLAFISGCQALEVLKLRLFRPKDGHLPATIEKKAPRSIPPLTPVVLPVTLREVHITDIAPWTARLLQGMSLPKSINLLITMIAGRDPPPSNRAWDTGIYTAFPAQKSRMDVLRCVDTVRVDVDADALVYRIAAHSSAGGGSTLKINADIRDAPLGEYLPDFLPELAKLFHKAPLTDLTIAAAGELYEAVCEEDWESALGPFPCLKRLAVSVQVTGESSHPHPLVPMLKVLGSPRDDGTELCSGLNVLVLDFPDTQREAAMMANVEECLRERAARGRSLSHIDILLDRDSESGADWAAREQSALERYKNMFQPYVGTVGCGDASYFVLDEAK